MELIDAILEAYRRGVAVGREEATEAHYERGVADGRRQVFLENKLRDAQQASADMALSDVERKRAYAKGYHAGQRNGAKRGRKIKAKAKVAHE